MPWRGPEVEHELPTLGGLVRDFIEERCAIPDGEHAGEPYVLTDEMLRFLALFYAIDPKTERFIFDRGGQIVWPQKKGKSPFAAAIVCAEAEGPVLFDGWDAQGEPVGRPWATPLIQITAVSEDQTDNTWRALVPMIDLGAIAGDIPDTGETRINLRSGGRIEPVTSSHRSRLGQRITFAVQDETHSWTQQNGGRKLADTQRRNLAPMGGRWLETTNAWDPAEESVAQYTFESGEPGVLREFSDAGTGSIRNKQERRRMLRRVYGDSWWATQNLERIEAEIEALLGRDPAQAERFFLNRIMAEEDAAFDGARWRQLADAKIVVPDRTRIVLGVDGARFDDALAVVATVTEIDEPYQFVVGIWERPETAWDDYEHPVEEIDGAVIEAFERYDVWRCYVDPQWIDHLLSRWQGRWGERKIIPWYTNRPKATAFMLRAYRTAIQGGDFRHDGNEQMARHIANARRQHLAIYDEDRRPMWTVRKDRPGSPRKIDAAMAGALSWEARSDAVSAGQANRRRSVYEDRGMSKL